jgi:hypothetical protein
VAATQPRTLGRMERIYHPAEEQNLLDFRNLS